MINQVMEFSLYQGFLHSFRDVLQIANNWQALFKVEFICYLLSCLITGVHEPEPTCTPMLRHPHVGRVLLPAAQEIRDFTEKSRPQLASLAFAYSVCQVESWNGC